ncbi:hypothetical protein ACKKBG_A18090 [Auxenochlorella protothecoides x Auxenochlorella symbiontica]
MSDGSPGRLDTEILEVICARLRKRGPEPLNRLGTYLRSRDLVPRGSLKKYLELRPSTFAVEERSPGIFSARLVTRQEVDDPARGYPRQSGAQSAPTDHPTGRDLHRAGDLPSLPDELLVTASDAKLIPPTAFSTSPRPALPGDPLAREAVLFLSSNNGAAAVSQVSQHVRAVAPHLLPGSRRARDEWTSHDIFSQYPAWFELHGPVVSLRVQDTQPFPSLGVSTGPLDHTAPK